jgi:MYXO-CTERM domain-containing protein
MSRSILALTAAVLISTPQTARSESYIPPPCTCDDDCAQHGMPYCFNDTYGSYCSYSGPGTPCDGGPPKKLDMTPDGVPDDFQYSDYWPAPDMMPVPTDNMPLDAGPVRTDDLPPPDNGQGVAPGTDLTDRSGCSVGGGSLGWPALALLLGLVLSRTTRRRRRS